MMRGDLLADLPVFVTVVEAGSFAAAALRLNLTRSAVGRTVARLEQRLGVRLFHRTTRSLALTEDGQVFFEHGQRVLGEIQNAAAMVESGRRDCVGRLSVSMPVLFGRKCIAPILITLAEAHPRLELDLNFSDRLVDPVEERIDLVVRSGPLRNWPGLTARRIAHQSMRICASPAYLASAGIPASLMDLTSHRAILYGRSDRTLSWQFPQQGGPVREIVPPSRLRFDDVGAIRDAALEGHGLAWLPDWLIRDDIASGRLVNVLGDEPAHAFVCHALWPQTPHLPWRVRCAINALAAALPSRVAPPAAGKRQP